MAARRFGGKHSPDAPANELRIEARKPANIRIRKKPGGFAITLLFLAAFPLLLEGFSQISNANPLGAATSLGCFALFVLAAWTLREGIKAETAYNERKIARPPLFPRKLIAAALFGTGVFVTTWLGWGKGMFTGLGLGALTVAAHLVAFGFDPMKRKGLPGFNEYETDRVARAVDKAEAIMAEIEDAARSINLRAVNRKIDSLLASVREMLRTVEQDPRDLTRARKYMGVYLKSARDATIKFAELNQRSPDPAREAEFVALITDLETSFNGERQLMLQDNQSDLEIEIEVLQERLKSEGHLARD